MRVKRNQWNKENEQTQILEVFLFLIRLDTTMFGYW